MGRPRLWASDAARMRATRERERRQRELWTEARGGEVAAAGADLAAVPLDVRLERLGRWAADELRVPGGHPAAGEALVLPDYILRFIGDVMQPGIRSGLLCMARKNAKTAGIAVLVLAHICEGGPLVVPGWRAAVASINKGKAKELLASAEGIARASGKLRAGDVRVKRSPYPGVLMGPYGGVVEVLAADAAAGTAAPTTW